nr:MAG TPA: NTP-PPase-like protein [Caudoviricetes sp.]
MQKKLKEIKLGEIFEFGGYEWIKLEDGLAITKDTVTESEFDSACNNYFMTSDIKSYLLETFAKEIWDNGGIYSDFDYFPLDLTADDGTKKYEPRNVQIGLLTTDLYRKNRCWLEPINDSWWLANPKSYNHKYDDVAMYVDVDGALFDEFAWIRDHGVRPVCKLAEETPVDVPDKKPIEQTEAEKEDITELIKKWAVDRNVVSGDPKAQMVKLLEEAGELAEGINKNKQDLIIDSIGDVYVVLVILCMQLGLDINDCIKAAYEEIKDRKGKLVNGLFVKEEDL